MTEKPPYHATAERSGEWWAIKIEGLTGNLIGATQSYVNEGWDKAIAMTRECVGLLLDVPEDSFNIVLTKEGEGNG